VIYQFCSV